MAYFVSVVLIILGTLVGTWVGTWVGWLEGQNTVATQCRLLGSFYVGDTVYECRVKEKV